MLHLNAKNTGLNAAEKTATDQHSEMEGSILSPSIPERDEAFDQSIREKLSTEVRSAQSQWNLLSSRLELIEERIRSIYRHKLLETAIILLLFLSAQNLFDYSANTAVMQLSHSGVHRNIFIENTSAEENNASDKPAIRNKSIKMDHSVPAETVTANTEQSASLSTPSSTRAQFTASVQPVISMEKELSIRTGMVSTPLLLANLTKVTPVKKEITFRRHTPEILKDKQRYSISFVTVANLNQIYTPGEIFLGNTIESYHKLSLGGGGGLTISKQGKNLTLESGLIYLSKRYHPNQLSLTSTASNGILYRETLHTVELNMLEIPFNVLMRKRLQHDKFSVYGGLGSTINLITTANYDYSRQYLAPVSGVSALGNTYEPSELKKMKKFNAGLFEGGTFRENTYLTAQLLLGFEVRMTPKWSVFSQATLQRQLSANGIGANNNHFHSYSLCMGFKNHF